MNETDALPMTEARGWQALITELRRRKVFRVATLYVITLWPVVQLADILQPALGFSDRVMTTLLYLFLGGFPIALALAWLFDLTRDGVVLTDSSGAAAVDPRPLIGRTAEGIVIGVLTLVVVALFLIKMTIDEDAGTAQLDAAAARSAAEATSIAVLPFTTFSTGEEDAVFADGLTEELLNQLARVPQLRVAARTSSFAYKGVNRNVQEIGRELGVGRVLEGSVRRGDVGATIRITAQLVDVTSGAHLWSQTYDREFHDVLRIQDEIAGAVAEHLSVALLGTGGQVAGTRVGAASPEALIAVSRGRAAIAKRSAASIVEGIAQLEQGVRASPDWAEAHASLAEAYVLSVLYASAEPRQTLARAQQAADRALELDAQLGAAWAALGLIRMQSNDQEAQAREALERAIALNPSYAMAYMWLGSLQDDPARMLELHRKALELDPRSAVAAYNVAHDLLEADREDEAMQMFDRIVAADPLYTGASRITAQLNERHGRLDEALLDYRSIWDAERDPGAAAKIAELSLALGDLDAVRRWAERGAASPESFAQIGMMWIRAVSEKLSGNTADWLRWLDRIARAANEQGAVGRLFSAFALSLAGEHAAAVERYDSAPRPDSAEIARVGKSGLADAYIAAVLSYRASGRPSDADRVLVSVRAQLDRRIGESPRVDPALLYQRARVHLLDGDRRMALVLLARAVDEGWTQGWRLEIDPLMQELRGEPRFQALEKALQASLATMRASAEAEHALR